MSLQSEEVNKLSGHLWKPLRALRDKAKGEREKALANEKMEKTQSNFFNTVSSGNLPTTLETGPLLSEEGYPREHDFAPTGSSAMMNMAFGVDKLYPLQTNHPNGSDITSASSLTNTNPFWPQVVANPQPMDGLNMNLVNDSLTIGLQQGLNSSTMPMQDINWASTSPDINNGLPIVNDDPMNWATFDDMVQQYAVQNEMHVDGANTVPGFYGTGSSLF
jgi:hypothetical protein